MNFPVTARLLGRQLRPGHLLREVRRIRGKLARRFRRIDAQVVTLEAQGPRVGTALFSFIIDPFLLRPGEAVSHAHTHDWESLEMARCLTRLGYEVDAIHWTNTRFVPQKDYDVVIDVRLNLERLAPLVKPSCRKIMHIETAHHSFHNPAQLRRLHALTARRGITLAPYRLLEVNRAIESADLATILGNEFTVDTYRFAGKPLYPIPISTPFLFPFPAAKDFAACRRSFMWFGSTAFVHKGLDLVLEAFASMPDFQLTVCGPLDREPAFQRAFYRELYLTPNIRTIGWVDIGQPAFLRLVEQCVGLIYPSCSEGSNGGTVTALHAGLIPIISYETGVDVADDFGHVLRDCTVESVRAAVHRLAARPPEELRAMAERAWEFARAHHTRERFSAVYQATMAQILCGEEVG